MRKRPTIHRTTHVENHRFEHVCDASQDPQIRSVSHQSWCTSGVRYICALRIFVDVTNSRYVKLLVRGDNARYMGHLSVSAGHLLSCGSVVREGMCGVGREVKGTGKEQVMTIVEVEGENR